MRPQITQNGQQNKQSGEYIVLARNPGNTFYSQGMKGKRESRKTGDNRKASFPLFLQSRKGKYEYPLCQEVENHGCQGMQKKIHCMITCRIHSPQYIIQSQQKPAKRFIISSVKRSEKYPLQMFPAQSPVVRIGYKVHMVIPCKGVPKGGKKGNNTQKKYKQRQAKFF